VGKILQESLSATPGVYRIGGDEFVLLIKMNHTQALALGEFIREEIEEHLFKYNDMEIKITVSIGIALNDGQMDQSLFFEAAEKALYQAKTIGRNQVVEYNDYFGTLEQKGIDPQIRDFENRIKVLTERLTSALTSKSKQIVTQFKLEADHDGLTGLFIRRYFDRRLTRELELARGKNRPLSLIFIDLDHFGQVNKTYGFPTGDQTLQYVAMKIKNTIRTVDWCARYGGEELCVILPDTEEKEACEIADRVWLEIGRDPVKAYDGRKFTITASIGVAELISTDTDITAFIQRTSDRTRYAKEHGRNQVCCHD
jgi:diguanylate cyclase (GGDEF)-like protein